jgi:hypothetical protein
MKKIVFAFLFFLVTSLFATAQEKEKIETGKIYFLRATGFALWNAPFKTFIDGKLVCKLYNNEYSIHDIAEGTHECSVQFHGSKSKEKTEKFKITILRGKLTYVQLSIKVGFVISKVYCEEITENTAKEKIIKMKENTEFL